MSDPVDWGRTEQHLAETFVDDESSTAVLAANSAAGLPPTDVAPAAGKFLNLLARAVDAQRILEIGTLGGHSTLWLARAVGPSGRVVTLELDPARAALARTNLDSAGVGDRVSIVIGPAVTTLHSVRTDDDTAFDLVFVDADVENAVDYVEWALVLGRPGTVIVVNHVVRDAQPVLDLLARHPRLDATALQTVGAAGHDAFAIALVIR